jgi:hypothetical protein
MIISVDAEKAFNTIQHHYMIAVLNKLGIERPYHDIIKVTYNKPISSIVLNRENLKISP